MAFGVRDTTGSPASRPILIACRPSDQVRPFVVMWLVDAAGRGDDGPRERSALGAGPCPVVVSPVDILTHPAACPRRSDGSSRRSGRRRADRHRGPSPNWWTVPCPISAATLTDGAVSSTRRRWPGGSRPTGRARGPGCSTAPIADATGNGAAPILQLPTTHVVTPPSTLNLLWVHEHGQVVVGVGVDEAGREAPDPIRCLPGTT